MTKPSKLKIVSSGHGSKLPQMTDKAIIALMSKGSIEAAAHAIGVSANTLLRWLKDPKFKESYQHARSGAFTQSLSRLQQASGMAVDTLLELMHDKKQSPAVRVRAADIMLGYACGADSIVERGVHVRQLATKH